MRPATWEVVVAGPPAVDDHSALKLVAGRDSKVIMLHAVDRDLKRTSSVPRFDHDVIGHPACPPTTSTT